MLTQRSDAKARVEFGIRVAQRDFIHTNYAQFREIYDRLNHRRGK